jgi:hypothetical protein
MKAAIQRFQGMVVEQDAKVKQAQDALTSGQESVENLKRKLANELQLAAEYRQALEVLRRPQLLGTPPMPRPEAPPRPIEAADQEKPSRKRA